MRLVNCYGLPKVNGSKPPSATQRSFCIARMKGAGPIELPDLTNKERRISLTQSAWLGNRDDGHHN